MRIVGLATNSWDGQWVNRQQLLSRLGRRHAVLYSTGGWFTWDRHSDEWRQAPMLGAIRKSDNVWIDEPPRVLMRAPRLPVADRAVINLQTRRWRRWLASHGDGPVVTYVFHPAFAEYARQMRGEYLVYHPHDAFELMPGCTPEVLEAERFLLDQADLAIAVTEQWARILQERSRRPIRVLSNGADVQAFVDAAAGVPREPTDLAAVPRPRIGYVGQLHPNLDFQLIRALATARPEWHFVFVGNKTPQRDEAFERDLDACELLANVHFLGGKPHTNIPRYTVNMDVNIMCYRLDRGWVQVGSPLKLHEYLASGRPIVGADLESVRPFRRVIRIATGVADWEHAIADALATGGPGTPADRVATARGHSWDDRANVLEAWLLELTQGRMPSAAKGG